MRARYRPETTEHPWRPWVDRQISLVTQAENLTQRIRIAMADAHTADLMSGCGKLNNRGTHLRNLEHDLRNTAAAADHLAETLRRQIVEADRLIRTQESIDAAREFASDITGGQR